ncbi:uncharacterized protein LOC108911559 [Anoplophora glabripennis]|uniref:uncharacterized protein LOC108911559 n=1 Tax=Anoplophora glabripennis TaxID=217634 RepID=UPI0008743A7A|nr:uncharacterized protein LOC108911559 [Anoplophora glabripennis]
MVKKEKDYQLRLIQHIYNQIPAFTDVFTEETFYMFAGTVVISTIIIVFIISRFVTLKPVDY